MAEATQSIDWQSVSNTLNSNHVPEIILILAGIIALLIVYTYLKDKESKGYKLAVLFGVIVGIATLVLCLTSPMKSEKYTLIIVAIGSFALIIRPFREVPFALVFAILGMVVTYIALGDLTAPLDWLSTGWARVIAAFIIGAIIFMLLFFLQNLVQFFAKILNAWPILIVVGVVCIAEGISLWAGYGSIVNLLMNKSNMLAIAISLL